MNRTDLEEGKVMKIKINRGWTQMNTHWSWDSRLQAVWLLGCGGRQNAGVPTARFPHLFSSVAVSGMQHAKLFFRLRLHLVAAVFLFCILHSAFCPAAGEKVRKRAGEMGLVPTSFAHLITFQLPRFFQSHLLDY